MFNYIFLTIILIIFVIFIIFYYKINTMNLSKRSGDKEAYDNKKKEIYDNKKEYVLDDIILQNLLEDYNKLK